ncbi:hypothetical protein Tco_1083686 [Tanacetum coccineum]
MRCDFSGVLDQNIEEEVKDVGLESIGDVTFEQIMNEYDQKNKAAQEVSESPYDKEFEIKIIKSFQPSQPADEDHIIFLGSEPINMESFEAADSGDEGSQSDHQDNLSKEGTAENLPETSAGGADETLNASANVPAQLEPLEQLPNFDKQIEQTLKAQLPKLVVKPINKQFNAFNRYETNGFVTLPRKLSTVIKTEMGKSIRMKVQKGMKEVYDKLQFYTLIVDTNSQHIKDLKGLILDIVFLLEAGEIFIKANAEGEKWEKNNPEQPTKEDDVQNPDPTQGEKHIEDANMANSLKEITSEENTSEQKVSDEEPPTKKLKFLIPTSTVPSQISLSSVIPEHLINPKVAKMIIYESKGKSIATEEPLKEIIPTWEKEDQP